MKSDRRHQPFQVQTTHLKDASPELSERFYAWVRQLDRDLDEEHGEDALDWVLSHKENVEAPYGTRIFLNATTGDIIATGSIVRDDRDVEQTYRLGISGFIGFVNIRRDLRGQGLGTLVMKELDSALQDYANTGRQNTTFALFTVSPATAKIAEMLSFQFSDTIIVEHFQTQEDLYKKTYLQHTPNG